LSQDALNLYIRFFLSGTLEIYRQWLKGNFQLTLDELGKFTSEVAFYGFSSGLKTKGNEFC
ncbi:MAG: hypothetical protein K2G88_07340, partial [Oscillospiraceae bacterium]|nr:hypothetical protein [Oscillospiraceae bacterium]